MRGPEEFGSTGRLAIIAQDGAGEGEGFRSSLDSSHRSETSMKTAKEEVREILDQVPDDASLEEIQYRIYVRQAVDRGLEDVKNGKTISQKEMESRMARWLGK